MFSAILTRDLLDRPRSSEALSDSQWRPRQSHSPTRRRHQLSTEIATFQQSVAIPFRQGAMVFSGPLPAWSYDLLITIGELGDLGEDWDSYGAVPVDPHCAAAAAELVLSLLGPDLPKPFIVPTNRGGLQLEWHRRGIDLKIEIESPTRLRVDLQDARSGEETELTLTGNREPLVMILDRLKAKR